MEQTINEEQVNEARKIIKSKLLISKYLEDNNLKYGDEAEGKIRCPIHNENTPSFLYDDVKGAFNCFGCSAGGTVLELHYKIQKGLNPKYSYIKAIYDLSSKYDIEIPNLFSADVRRNERTAKVSRWQQRRKENRQELIEERNEQKLDGYNTAFKNAPPKVKIIIGQLLDQYYLNQASASEVVKRVDKIKDKMILQYQKSLESEDK